MQTTSVLRNPVFVNGENYDGAPAPAVREWARFSGQPRARSLRESGFAYAPAHFDLVGGGECGDAGECEVDVFEKRLRDRVTFPKSRSRSPKSASVLVDLWSFLRNPQRRKMNLILQSSVKREVRA